MENFMEYMFKNPIKIDHEFVRAFQNCDYDRLEIISKSKRDILRAKVVYNRFRSKEQSEHSAKNLFKSDKISNFIRNQGNKLLREVKSEDAFNCSPIIDRYESALCFADSDECKYKAFVNLSKMYQNMNMPELSVRAANMP
ncbi:hypothetical protein ACFFRR_011230 [Megaselia abdita]